MKSDSAKAKRVPYLLGVSSQPTIWSSRLRPRRLRVQAGAESETSLAPRSLALSSVGQLEIGLLLMRPQSFVYLCVMAALNPSFFPEAISSGASPPPGTQIWLRGPNRTWDFFVRVREEREIRRRRHLEEIAQSGAETPSAYPGCKNSADFCHFNYSSSAPLLCVFILADIVPARLGALVLMFWCRRLALLAEPRINGACQFRPATLDGHRTPNTGRGAIQFLRR